MLPIQHPLCNDILRRPPGTTEEECADLHIRRQEDGVLSFWQPGEAEIMAINSGQPIVFHSRSSTHPPISISVLVPPPVMPPNGAVSERIKAIADGYLAACFRGDLAPRQAIEIKLALYGGMMAMFRERENITLRHGDDDEAALAEVLHLGVALVERAHRLNEERANLPT